MLGGPGLHGEWWECCSRLAGPGGLYKLLSIRVVAEWVYNLLVLPACRSTFCVVHDVVMLNVICKIQISVANATAGMALEILQVAGEVFLRCGEHSPGRPTCSRIRWIASIL